MTAETTTKPTAPKAPRAPRTTKRSPKPGVTNTVPAKAEPAKQTPPTPEPDPKPNKSDAKTDLGRRAVLALDAMFAGLDDSDLALAGWTREEAAQCLANWVHHFPVGRDGKGRTWPATTLPKPDRSDWL